MKRCKCGSYAINEDPAEEQCDPCYWCTQADEALQRNIGLEAAVDELFAWVNSGGLRPDKSRTLINILTNKR